MLPDGKRRETMTYDDAGNLETRDGLHGPHDDVRLRRQQPPRSPARYPNAGARTSASPTRRPAGGRPPRTPAARRATATTCATVCEPDQPDLGRHGAASSYAYDGNGNRTTLTADPVGGQTSATSYTYDDAGRLDVGDGPGRPRLRPRLRPQRQPHQRSPSPTAPSPPYTYDTLNRLTNLATTHPVARHDRPELRLHARPRRQPHADRRGRRHRPRTLHATTRSTA